MKLYGDFKKEDWIEALNLNNQSIPETFIIHGEWEHQENLTRWKNLLVKEQWLSDWNTVIGNYKEKRIGFSNVFGGPSAAITAHRFAILGTEKLIQTGYFGGLSHDVRYGDILIVTGAYMEDGVSQWYLPSNTMAHADQKLVQAAIDYCEKKGYSYRTGSIMSTSSMYMETAELVISWAGDGHLGVDMETATTFSIAKYFNRKAIGLLNLSNHIIQGETFYSRPEELNEIMDETDVRIRELALHIASLTI